MPYHSYYNVSCLKNYLSNKLLLKKQKQTKHKTLPVTMRRNTRQKVLTKLFPGTVPDAEDTAVNTMDQNPSFYGDYTLVEGDRQ